MRYAGRCDIFISFEILSPPQSSQMLKSTYDTMPYAEHLPFDGGPLDISLAGNI
jgi:hypothetical protein